MDRHPGITLTERLCFDPLKYQSNTPRFRLKAKTPDSLVNRDPSIAAVRPLNHPTCPPSSKNLCVAVSKVSTGTGMLSLNSAILMSVIPLLDRRVFVKVEWKGDWRAS